MRPNSDVTREGPSDESNGSLCVHLQTHASIGDGAVHAVEKLTSKLSCALRKTEFFKYQKLFRSQTGWYEHQSAPLRFPGKCRF